MPCEALAHSQQVDSLPLKQTPVTDILRRTNLHGSKQMAISQKLLSPPMTFPGL